MPSKIALPYLELLLEARARGLPEFHTFEKHIHWGYWPYPEQATGTADDLREAMQRLDDEFLRVCAIEDGLCLLDAGCGFGGTIASIDGRYSGMTLVGLNIDERQLAVAAGPTRSGNTNQVAFIAGNASCLPFSNQTFDRVIAVECIFHFRTRQSFLEEAARVLRPNGLLVLSDFVPRSTDPRVLWLGTGIQRLIESGYGKQSTDWPRGGYQKMADRAGLELLLDRDITVNSLPTYAAMRRLVSVVPLRTRALRRAITITELLSRLGQIRYRILSFRKSAAPKGLVSPPGSPAP